MLPYYLKCRKKTDCKNPKVAKTNKGELMILSKFAVCHSEKSRFFKKQKASGLLSNLGSKTHFSKLPLLYDILF